MLEVQELDELEWRIVARKDNEEGKETIMLQTIDST